MATMVRTPLYTSMDICLDCAHELINAAYNGRYYRGIERCAGCGLYRPLFAADVHRDVVQRLPQYR